MTILNFYERAGIETNVNSALHIRHVTIPEYQVRLPNHKGITRARIQKIRIFHDRRFTDEHGVFCVALYED
jgi:hypothetical protein